MERQGGSKTEQATMTDANLCGQFISAGPGFFFFKAKDSAFDEPAVGPSTIATAPSPLICPEDRRERQWGQGWEGGCFLGA